MLSTRVMRLLAVLALISACPVAANAEVTVPLTPFSGREAGGELPAEWPEVTVKSIPRHTRYSLVRDGNTVVLRADSNASMSSLHHAANIDPARTPFLRWRWKVENLIAKSELGRKSGDDFPARVYVFFDYRPEKLSLVERMKLRLARSMYGMDLPLAALCYVWDRQAPRNRITSSPFTDRVRMIVAESGATHLNQWVEVSRNVAQDFESAFREAVPRITGIALATDTDNTGASAVAFFGDFRFESGAR